MLHLQPPQPLNNDWNGVSVFLAGGITGCPDWQETLVVKLRESLHNFPIVILNPRRDVWDDNIKGEEQITWEFNAMKMADIIVFWFPKETLCPIALYELGRMLAGNKPVFIGIHPEYSRKEDIITQARLARESNYRIFSTLDSLATCIVSYVKKW